ncbi:MAG TPA: glucosaminidase domain-containing protein [Acidimicrobiales bacterium]|jgi:hypothetical protein|nr:glucosaminidase domain-containing protein [Acidimicrobiales bacterium]
MVPFCRSTVVRAACAALAVSMMAVAVLVATLEGSAAALPAAKPKPTTTTVAPTTTTLVPISVPQHGAGGPSAPPPPGGSTTTSTTVPIVPIPTAVVNALVVTVQDSLAELDAINTYDQEKGVVSVDLANAASADQNAQTAEKAQAQAQAQVDADQVAFNSSQHALSSLAVALYVRADVGAAAQNADAADPEGVNRSVMLAILISHGQDDYELTKRQLQYDTATLDVDKQRAEVARAEQVLAHQALQQNSTRLTNAKLAAAGQKVISTTGTPIPTIMGPSALTADELATWYSSTGYQANTTVPMATLAGDYVTTAASMKMRGDIAFAQSIVETGYFTFPSYGQVLGTDNNFAGIGACDSCPHGWTFPNAQTGVAAQLQLLQAYASPTKVATPLVGRVGVAGCCQTWLALSGVWATNPNYGYEILKVYQEILNWAIPVRLAAAGL